MDINNQAPTIDEFEHQVFIYENATTGSIVGQIRAHDNDRDSQFFQQLLKVYYLFLKYFLFCAALGPHNILEYTINSALGDLHNLFQINNTNGELKVNLRNGLTLDRDMGTTFHYIPIDIRDNFNFINSGYGRKSKQDFCLNFYTIHIYILFNMQL